jgi:hypothetical protein
MVKVKSHELPVVQVGVTDGLNVAPVGKLATVTGKVVAGFPLPDKVTVIAKVTAAPLP